MSKLETLAEFLECSVEEVNKEYEFFVTNNDEAYLVFTDDEADARFKEYMEGVLMDVGLCAFTDNAKSDIMDTCVHTDYLRSIIEDEIKLWCEDLKEDNALEEILSDSNCETLEEYIENTVNEWENYECEYFINSYGEDGFNDMVRENIDDILDINAICEYVKRVDGRGNCLASWDGIENELNNYYIYRID